MLVFTLLVPPALLGAVLLLGRLEERLADQLAPRPAPGPTESRSAGSEAVPEHHTGRQDWAGQVKPAK